MQFTTEEFSCAKAHRFAQILSHPALPAIEAFRDEHHYILDALSARQRIFLEVVALKKSQEEKLQFLANWLQENEIPGAVPDDALVLANSDEDEDEAGPPKGQEGEAHGQGPFNQNSTLSHGNSTGIPRNSTLFHGNRLGGQVGA